MLYAAEHPRNEWPAKISRAMPCRASASARFRLAVRRAVPSWTHIVAISRVNGATITKDADTASLRRSLANGGTAT